MSGDDSFIGRNSEANRSLHIETGKKYLCQGDYGLALETLKKALAEDPTDGQALFELGKVYYLQKRYLLARDLFGEVTRAEPKNVYAYILLAKSYQSLGENKLACNTFKKISEMEVSDYKIRMELCEFFKENKMFDLAIKEYERVLKDGSNKTMLLDLLSIYNFEGEHDKVKNWAGPFLGDETWQEPFFKNRLLNELEIAQGRLILQSKPRILLITLTNRCNLNCYMCGKGESAWEISQDMIDQIVSWLPYLELITWQGGEVFWAGPFRQILDKTLEYNELKQIIITNALLITEEWAQRLAAQNNIGLTISIDSVDKKDYERIRRGASFEKLTQNLKLINRARKGSPSNMTTSLRCTIMKTNYTQLEEFIEFAHKYEFDIVQMAPLSSDPYDPENIFMHEDKDVMRCLTQNIPRVRELAQKYRIKLLDWIPYAGVGDVNVDDLKETTPMRIKPICFRPWKQIAMNVRGDLFPECLCSEPIGDIFHIDLEEVWNNEKMQMYRRMLSANEYTKWCNPCCISGAIPAEHLKFTYV